MIKNILLRHWFESAQSAAEPATDGGRGQAHHAGQTFRALCARDPRLGDALPPLLAAAAYGEHLESLNNDLQPLKRIFLEDTQRMSLILLAPFAGAIGIGFFMNPFASGMGQDAGIRALDAYIQKAEQTSDHGMAPDLLMDGLSRADLTACAQKWTSAETPQQAMQSLYEAGATWDRIQTALDEERARMAVVGTDLKRDLMPVMQAALETAVPQVPLERRALMHVLDQAPWMTLFGSETHAAWAQSFALRGVLRKPDASVPKLAQDPKATLEKGMAEKRAGCSLCIRPPRRPLSATHPKPRTEITSFGS